MDSDSEVRGARTGPWRSGLDLPILWAIQAGCARPSRRKYHGTRVDFTAWLGRKPTPAARVALSRALSRLEKRGLVVRLPGRRAVLTRAGSVAAAAGQEASRPEPAMSLTPADPRADGEPGWDGCPAAQELSPTAQQGANGAPACAAARQAGNPGARQGAKRRGQNGRPRAGSVPDHVNWRQIPCATPTAQLGNPRRPCL